MRKTAGQGQCLPETKEYGNLAHKTLHDMAYLHHLKLQECFSLLIPNLLQFCENAAFSHTPIFMHVLIEAISHSLNTLLQPAKFHLNENQVAHLTSV